MGKREELIEKIRAQGFVLPIAQNPPFPLVSLEDFFLGNEDYGSIGCNLLEHPGLEQFFERLKFIRERQDVQDVLVAVIEIEEDFPDMWPFSDHIYIITSASRTEVENWLAELQPDEVVEGWATEKPSNAPEILPGFNIFHAWWD
ncbi:hypothetical protein [Coleofasciculus sp.]|uniref:hypothetical protein n=1 Tax=Coleofasciculus sp. TaxID=3100458 RepID=UPI0039F81E2C